MKNEIVSSILKYKLHLILLYMLVLEYLTLNEQVAAEQAQVD